MKGSKLKKENLQEKSQSELGRRKESAPTSQNNSRLKAQPSSSITPPQKKAPIASLTKLQSAAAKRLPCRRTSARRRKPNDSFPQRRRRSARSTSWSTTLEFTTGRHLKRSPRSNSTNTLT